jgi:DNA-binding Lrp family transcriptional regulator
MNPLDERIVRATQAGLPLAAEPYRTIAASLGIEQSEVLSRLETMLADGRIRRIGAVPNHYALGYTANAMSVWDVADEAVDELGAQVGALACVTHCYRRPRRLPEWRYNLFAMVHGRSRADAEAHLAQVRALLAPALRAHDVLYSTRILKKTGLRLT